MKFSQFSNNNNKNKFSQLPNAVIVMKMLNESKPSGDSSTTAIIGKAVLGKMILNKETS